MRLLKIILYLVVLGVIALLGFAYFGDLSPQRTEIRIPVEIDG